MVIELEPVPPNSILLRADYLRKSLVQIAREIAEDPTANQDDREWVLNIYGPWHRKHPRPDVSTGNSKARIIDASGRDITKRAR